MISTTLNILYNTLEYLFQSLWHNGLYLFISIAVGVAMTVYINPEKARNYFLRKSGFLIPGSVLIGAITPLCACGTMAVIFSLVSTALPWGAIMAFLVSSPLMSPDTFILLSGFMGLKFTIILAASSVVLGFAVGYLTWFLERKTSVLSNQLKFLAQKTTPVQEAPVQAAACGCSTESTTITSQKLDVLFCCAGRPEQNAYLDLNVSAMMQIQLQKLSQKLKLNEFAKAFYDMGIKKILPLFALFVVIAYLVKTFVPTEWVVTMFSGEHFYSVPLAAIVGIPLYVSDATIVPLLQVFKDAGASNGALLAFMIAGPGTSLGVFGGLMIILKKRALMLYVSYILVGAVVLGYLTDWLF